ncbi:hypothetical protein ASF65_20370 [Aureimonas sp. Leaf324]|jgi:hypothetical protein|nr:hypothetical protein ASF65_20370 [Aureimonas sp. Leaf324]
MQDDRPSQSALRQKLIRANRHQDQRDLKCDACLMPLDTSAIISLAEGFEIDLCPECLQVAQEKLQQLHKPAT